MKVVNNNGVNGFEVEVGDMFLCANKGSSLCGEVFKITKITKDYYHTHNLSLGNCECSFKRELGGIKFNDYIGITWIYLGHLENNLIRGVILKDLYFT